MTYRGRFAPTPSGDLHRGSLLTAVASYLDARQANGAWHLRIDDIDPPREVPGAADRIQQQLAAHALHWDGSVQYQSQRHDAYAAAVDMLLASGHAFYCALSRRQLADLGGDIPGRPLPSGLLPTRAPTPTRTAPFGSPYPTRPYASRIVCKVANACHWVRPTALSSFVAGTSSMPTNWPARWTTQTRA